MAVMVVEWVVFGFLGGLAGFRLGVVYAATRLLRPGEGAFVKGFTVRLMDRGDDHGEVQGL